MLRHGTSRAERLSDVLGQEVVAQVVASGVTAADPTIHEQIASLQARSGELEGELRSRDEELDAVRQANRDLWANSTGDVPSGDSRQNLAFIRPDA